MPVFDSFEVALIGNQRLTSAQGSVGTTSGSGGSQTLRRFPLAQLSLLAANFANF